MLQTALGVVLAREGIDVRVYLWSGGVEDVVLPVMGDLGRRLSRPVPVGSQVIVTFLSDRTASGMVMAAMSTWAAPCCLTGGWCCALMSAATWWYGILVWAWHLGGTWR